ncbi:hypothetical protein HGA64_02130 [Candidatus Falkowbacteria bacterium]|nr:hypothetical protein [Candidatus Falkowbacteria bacterium]
MRKKTLDFVSLGIIVMLVISGCGRNLSSNRHEINAAFTINNKVTTARQNDAAQVVVKPPTSTTTSLNIGTTTKTDDWQVYRDELSGIEFKYQPYWKKATHGIAGDLAEQKIVKLSLFNNYNSSQKEALPLLNISIYGADRKFNSFEKDVAGVFLKKQKINNVEMSVYKKESYFGTGYSSLIKLKNGNFLLIKIDQIKSNGESIKIFNQIISTVRFI